MIQRCFRFFPATEDRFRTRRPNLNNHLLSLQNKNLCLFSDFGTHVEFSQEMKTDQTKSKPLKPCDQNIKKTIEIADRLISLATKGDADREDNGCGVLYGIMLDSAYKIRRLAEIEKEEHIKKGWWQE